MKNLCQGYSNTTGNSVPPRCTSLYLAALLNYRMKKRKLENGAQEAANVLPVRKRTSLVSLQIDCSKRLQKPISTTDLKSIQMQLALLSDDDGDRPIHVAVANEDIKLVQKLCFLMVKNSISLNSINYLRQTPLHLAVMLGNADLTKLLLNFGACPLISDRNGNSVLHLAVKSNNNKDVLNALFAHPKVQNILNSMDYEGYSALHYAVLKNDFNAVKMLESAGADMNKIDGKSGRTALIHAVLEQNTSMVDLLLNCGTFPQKTDYSGRSAFEMALQVANVPIIKLIEKWLPRDMLMNEQIKPLESTTKVIKRTKVSK